MMVLVNSFTQTKQINNTFYNLKWNFSTIAHSCYWIIALLNWFSIEMNVITT